MHWLQLSDCIDKQAGAELCQAQAQVGLPAEAWLNLIPDLGIKGFLNAS
jgi:hypothetical protein